MTSIPPAEPRPPLQAFDPPKAFANSFFTLDGPPMRIKAEGDLSSSQESQGIDDRPTKRRKLSADNVQIPQSAVQGTSGAKTTLVDDFRVLSTVLRGKPPDENEQESAEPPPLPRRPWQIAPASEEQEEPKPTHRARSPVPVPTTPDTAYTPPESVPRLLNKKHAAYFPWTGKHAEDNLCADNVKTGFYDRAPNPQEKETSTARVPLYHALKHRSGVESLSTLFSLVLEAKNKHGLISSVSTFKPPPRVTLAEAKRRSWIADLADANVPLRKLSRTIPQGIRGQGLLDQCIQNNVPLSRAIWFAKCVGANEIRTLKRKGTTPQAAVGTEGKWLREWTLNTEQFLNSILAQVTQPLWKADIQYALRLATRLYLENLIDRDHYLDWIVKSLSQSSDERLPFWLMMLYIYKQDIIKFRKRSRTLAEALINRYSKLKDQAHGTTQSLVKKLRDAIKGLAMHRSYCFLMPDQWPSIRDNLASCLDATIAKETLILRHLDQINERCMGSNKHSYLAKPSDKDTAIKILDSASAPYDVAPLSTALLSACSEIESLVIFCLEWATTRFRYGSARVYLISRLLRRWQRQGLDVDSAVVVFLTSLQPSINQDFEALRHILSELSRSQIFPVSKYLEWLNVRGLPRRDTIRINTMFTTSGQRVLQQQGESETQLLMDLSIARPSGHVANLRNALLGRGGFDEKAEVDSVNKVIAQLQEDLSSLASSEQLEPGHRKSTAVLLSTWSWTVRSKISHWLRSYVANIADKRMANKVKSPLQRIQALSNSQFEFVRLALENLADEAVLADVVGLCSSFNEEQLQSSLVETIARHADAFSAIGASESLQTRFCQIYTSLRGVKLTMPLFATALLDLCIAVPSKYISTRLLQQDLVRGDRSRAMAACSPFSDGIAESLQQAENTFIDDFEAVLQSEPSMHEQTMARLFELLTERIEKQQGTIVGEDALFSYCQLMARLRWCRIVQGDKLLKAWLTRALSKYAATFTRNLVFSLIGTGCLTVDVLLETISAIGRKTVVAYHGWLVSPDSATEHPCAYSATSKWIEFGTRKPQEALNLLGHAIETDRTSYERRFCTSFMLSKAHNIDPLSEASRKLVAKALEPLLGGGKRSESSVASALRSLDVFSLRFVEARLQLQAASTATEGDSNATANALVDHVNDPSRDTHTNHLLSSLLAATEDGVASQVRQVIEERVLNMLPKVPSGKSAQSTSVDATGLSSVKRAIDQAFELCPKTSSPTAKSNSKLVDALSQILRHLGNTGQSVVAPTTPAVSSPTSNSLPWSQSVAEQMVQPTAPMDTSSSFSLFIMDYFKLLLRLLCLQRPKTPSISAGASLPPHPKQSSDTVRALAFLASIVTHPALRVKTSATDPTLEPAIKETLDFAYDVMATYVDGLSEEGRILLSRILRDKLKDGSDSRLKKLFGSVSTCGSDMPGGEELGKGLLVVKRDADGGSKGKLLGEWHSKVWEVVETGGKGDADVSVGLGLFDARRV